MGGGPFFLLFLFVAVAADRYDPFPEEAFVSGEIDILTWNTTSAAGMQSSALRDPRMKWPEAKVFVKFHSSISSEEKNMITHAMREIQQKTCVRFHYSNDQTQDFVLLVKPNSHACSSFVGKRGSKQQLNLGHGCYHRSVILHELMHVLGFIHEHNRSDRDQYVTIIRQNIQSGQEHNFNKRSAADLTLMDTPYSYDSVMHYEGNLFSKDNQSPTIVPKRKVKLGGGEGLSPIDVQRINRYYGCGTTSQPNKQVHQGENENQLTTEEETPNWNDWHEQQRQRFQQQVKAWKEKVTTFQDQFKNQMQMQQQTWQNKPGQGQQSWSSWSSW